MQKLGEAINGEMDLISQGLIQRVKVLAQRYYHPLPQLMGEVTTLESMVTKHLENMCFSIDFDLLQN
jgi:hypothetical protein